MISSAVLLFLLMQVTPAPPVNGAPGADAAAAGKTQSDVAEPADGLPVSLSRIQRALSAPPQLKLLEPSWRNGRPFFRVDIEGDDISDRALADYLVADMRLLMVGAVRILDKRVFAEPRPSVGNTVRFRLSPDVAITVDARAKRPGEEMIGEETELSVVHHPHGDEMEAYERLIGDAMEGETTLFARQDVVEGAWTIVEPILHIDTPPIEYEPGTWGPAEADRLTEPIGGWQAPVMTA